ncbi:MAG TPA: hypothetical protein QGF41_02185 [Gammaproteobacteria bacterium]|jgi:hypothetical protein|nr:hypothetical protein [Arenicellales bacterium]HJN94506.1 hypothetical protein [Gammaproteobacteria bacterium]|tara:strand:- start:11410 stop:11931 length:522 start_codon:yes stop_codon:yes gene_type:complete
MTRIALTLAATACIGVAVAQTPAPAEPPSATDVTAEDISKFIDALPRDRVSDRPIRTVSVTGDYRVGVYGVFRPKEIPGGANLHPVNTTEIYYMLKGYATLVTGGTLIDPRPAPSPSTSIRSSGIEGGVSRRIVPGDVVVIPGHTPHYWSELETDIEYLIFRPDPDNRITLVD